MIRVTTSSKGYGGSIYERYIDRVFANHPDYSVVGYRFRLKGLFRILELPFYLYFCWSFSRNKDFFVIRNFNTAFFPFFNESQGITIVFHVDETGSGFLGSMFQKLLEKLFFARQRFGEKIVVIAKFWKDYFIQKNYRSVTLIYCPYDMESYEVTQAEVTDFKKKYNLSDKPIFYLGNPQAKKGFLGSYAALKSFPAYLVTSGEGELKHLARHMFLGFREYLTLLKSAQIVVTMSEFKEGWCRVAHEALLLGTPVIGSGRGGMGELLKEGGGLVCHDFQQLPDLVNKITSQQVAVSINEQYLKSFIFENFARDWEHIVQK